MLTLIKLLAPFSILAGMVLGCVMYALSLAELDVKARDNDMSACEDVRVVQAAAIANMPICKPIKGKFRRVKK